MKLDRSTEALISCNSLLETVTDWTPAIVCFKKEKKLIIHTRVAGIFLCGCNRLHKARALLDGDDEQSQKEFC